MYKLSVTYGTLTGEDKFDYDYYVNTHIPLILDALGGRRAEVDRFVSNPRGGDPPFHVAAHVYFDTLDEVTAALTSPRTEELRADLRNFYNGRNLTMSITETQEIKR